MTAEEFTNILEQHDNIEIVVLGNLYHIHEDSTGECEIATPESKEVHSYSSIYEMIKNHMIMNMSLESLTPWLKIACIA